MFLRKLWTQPESYTFSALTLKIAHMTLGQDHDTSSNNKQSLCKDFGTSSDSPLISYGQNFSNFLHTSNDFVQMTLG